MGRASYCRALSVAGDTGCTTCESRIRQLPCANLYRPQGRLDTFVVLPSLLDHATRHSLPQVDRLLFVIVSCPAELSPIVDLCINLLSLAVAVVPSIQELDDLLVFPRVSQPQERKGGCHGTRRPMFIKPLDFDCVVQLMFNLFT
ncbi:hypothetical protein BpHYR1_027400 [Brachionus plicatilis]|uniref:Uncharacterized protein n=1 Tax=Brachionus plicatilis TaxID=10195 RepID=A0A3M7Q4Y5_BRAPC|nr:hypothetical protein BpHYR1_027400 [Brachionus plicatilis]